MLEQLVLEYQKSGSPEILNSIYAKTVNLVKYFANKNYSKKYDTDDLIQEGSMGVMKAIRLFKPEFSTKFSYYASIHIHKMISDFARADSIIRFPQYLAAPLRKLREGDSIDTVLDDYDVNRGSLNNVSLHIKGVSSFEDFGDEFNIPSNFTTKEMETKILKDLLIESINILDDREKHIIMGVYYEKTLEEIGIELNLTRERIRQIRNVALNKLKLHLEKQGEYNDYI